MRTYAGYSWLLALLFVGGCKEPVGESFGDTRVDHAGTADGGIEALAPVVCMDEPGSIHVAWYDDRSGSRGIWYNRTRDGGTTWLTADIRLDTATSNADAVAPSIACVANRVYVVWEDRRDGELDNANIRFNSSDDRGLTWLEEDVALDADPEGAAMSLAPQIQADSSGVYVAWYDNRNGAYDVFLNVSTDGGSAWFGQPVRVDTDDRGSAYSASPVVAVDGAGSVVVAWEDSRDGLSDVYVNSSTDYGQTFGSSDVRLDIGDAGSADSFYPRLARDGAHVYVAWHDTASGFGRDIYVAHSADGGLTWGSAFRPETAPEGNVDALYPSIAARGAELHVAWQDDRSGGYDIFYRKSLDGGATWEKDEIRLDRDTAGLSHSNRARLLVHSNDTVLVVWEDHRADEDGVGFNDLYYNFSSDAGTTWSSGDFRVNGNRAGTAYAVDAWSGHSGNAGFFVWADGRFGSADIFFNALVLGESAVYTAPED